MPFFPFSGSNVEQFSLLRIAGNRYMSDDSKGKKRGKTPIGKLDQTETTEKDESADVYAPFPDNKNPVTGEIGGPRGPEPTRYGDWERKGRVTDF